VPTVRDEETCRLTRKCQSTIGTKIRTALGPHMGHTSRRRTVSQRYSWSLTALSPGPTFALVARRTTPPIFQAGHEGSIPFARSFVPPQVRGMIAAI
jgi:hypothetical protein